jgi:hypothetical protein
MSLAALNDKFGLVTDAALIAAIWIGIACVAVAPAIAETVVTVAGVAAGVIGAVQVMIIRGEKA